MKSYNKARFKFNNGRDALLCSKCSVIIKTGYQFTEKERMAALLLIDLPEQFCEKCSEYKTITDVIQITNKEK